MRRLVTAVFALMLIGAGIYMDLIVARHPTVYAILRGAAIAVFLGAIGTFLLWDDVIKPLANGKNQRRP